ncbi:extracellular solute-binding protein [Paenibacillus sp. HB172176]|uniref:extracellular solute-binding protein n=1 Tax=Paenibacillus sp. HB172176 TaxID=2493690 RepID=UPI00143BC99B|nr:extracellular solute-binding protein [Paenibacillus sp. HB172176]
MAKRRITALFMIMALTAGLLAGCSGNSGNNGNGAGATKEANEGNGQATGGDKTDTVKIYAGTEVWKSTFPIPSLVHKEIENKFNIEFDPIYTWVNADTETKLSVMFASGDYPEALLHVNNPEFVKNLGRQGYLLPVNDMLDQIPNYRDLWTDEEWDIVMKKAGNEDGNLYYLPIKNYRTHSNAWIYREDVFEKLGIAFPQTLDELYEVLKTLKKEFPDSVPMTNRGGIGGLVWGIDQANRTSYGIFADPDLNNEIVFGPATDKYRESMKFLHKLYKENLIEKEFATITYDQWLQRHYSDKTYIEWSYGSRAADFNMESKDIAGVNWNWSGTIIGADGKPGLAVREDPFYSYGPVFTNRIKQENLDRLLEYVNWSVTPEGTRLHEWGVEGETYEMKDGKPAFLASIENDPDKRDKLLEYGMEYFLNRDLDMVESSPQTLIDLQVSEAFANWENEKKPFFNWTEELGQEKAKLQTNIDDVKEQYSVQFVMGQLDPEKDGDWQKYIQALKKAGLDRFVEIHKLAAAN